MKVTTLDEASIRDIGQAGFFCVFPAIGGSCMLRHV